MKHRIVLAALSLGAVGGFASEFHQLARDHHHHRAGHRGHRHHHEYEHGCGPAHHRHEHPPGCRDEPLD